MLNIGGVEVQRVVELLGPFNTVDEMFPDTPPESWTGDLALHHRDPQTRAYREAIQTWVLRSGDRTVLIDAGVGNDRDRPQVPPLAHLHTDFLARLADAGVRHEEADVLLERGAA